MANENENPELIENFCSDGTKDEIPEFLKVAGYSPENPNPNGYVLNQIFNQIFNQLNHQKNKGFSFWESDKPYTAVDNNIDIVRRNNKIYFAKQSHNSDGTTPKTPENNPDFWGVVFDFDNPNENLYSSIKHNHNGTYALLAGSSTQKFKVATAANSDEAVNKALLESFVNSGFMNTYTGGSVTTSPNDFHQGAKLFLHSDCPNSINNWYIIAINYTQSENKASMQLAINYNSSIPEMYVRTKAYSTTAWRPWQQLGKKIKRLSYTGSTIDGSNGFSSVVRTATGRYTCYFSEPMPDTNYSVVSSVLGSDFVIGYSKATNYVAINRLHSSDNVYYDGGFSLAILED